MLTHQVAGSYNLGLTVAGDASTPRAEVVFSDDGARARAYLAIDSGCTHIIRELDGAATILKTLTGAGAPPWRIRVLRKGNYYRVWVNDSTGWVRGPLGEWEGIYEPWESRITIEGSEGTEIHDCTVTSLPWLQAFTEPVIRRGPAGSRYEEQVIPGAVIEFDGRFYMYCMAGMRGTQEGSSHRSIGVAVSDDLESWQMQPDPIFTHADFPGDNLYPNGAVVTPEGKVAILFCAQQFPEWLGFMLATADHPLGPFTPYAGNPVYKHFTIFAHEFDLVRVDHPDYRYVFFYSGDTPRPAPDIARGDRGYVLYSDDLIHWREDPGNPLFGPQTPDNWDAIHVRPRSLTRIGDRWYLWYEGCNVWTPPGGESSSPVWCDTVGLARSPDLVNWEYYPRNPALPALGTGADRFDHTWTGWPRMLVKDGVGYVFYTGDAQVGLRKIPIDQLTDWSSEGGTTIRLA